MTGPIARTTFIQWCNAQRLARIPRARIAAALIRAFRLVRLRPLPIALTFVDDRTIARLHRRFLGVSGPTDVISFPLQPDENPGEGDPIGEVVVSVETAIRTARRRCHAPSAEIALYAVHGILHLLGFEDGNAAEVERMRAAERECLKAAGIEKDLFGPARKAQRRPNRSGKKLPGRGRSK